MRILFWTDGFWPRIGGTETQGLEFVQAMQKRGHSCVVLCQKDDGTATCETYRDIPIQRFDFNAILKTNDLASIRLIRNYLQWALEDFKADLIYLNAVDSTGALPFLLFRKQLPIPAIATIHAPHFELIPIVSQILNAMDQIVCVSKWARNTMQEKLPSHHLEMIYCGISLPPIPPTPLPFSPPTLLLLGRLSYEKGFDIAIKACALLKNKPELIIAGDGKERPYLEHLVRKFKLTARFTGVLPREEIYSTINQSTLVLMPSHLEAFGLVALESMRMGRPVIASHVGGLPELISHGERGLLVPPNDPLALSHAIEQLLAQPSLCNQMGQNARKWATQKFLIEENVDAYEKIFQSHCHHRRV